MLKAFAAKTGFLSGPPQQQITHRSSLGQHSVEDALGLFEAKDKLTELPNRDKLIAALSNPGDLKTRYEQLKAAENHLMAMPDKEAANQMRQVIASVLQTVALPALTQYSQSIPDLLNDFLVGHGNPGKSKDDFVKFIGGLQEKFDGHGLEGQSLIDLHEALTSWLQDNIGEKDGKVIAVLALTQALGEQMSKLDGNQQIDAHLSLKRNSSRVPALDTTTDFALSTQRSASLLLKEMEKLAPKIADYHAALGHSPRSSGGATARTLSLKEAQDARAIGGQLGTIVNAFEEDPDLLQSCLASNPTVTRNFIETLPSGLAPGVKEKLTKSAVYQNHIASATSDQQQKDYEELQVRARVISISVEEPRE